jgi:uncharacterized glyoxalase superfamily protein PhnB
MTKPPSANPLFTSVSLRLYYFSPRHTIIHIIEKAVSPGARLVKPPQAASWGGYHGYFKDPDGYLWEVAYNPHFWVGSEEKNL